MEKNIYKLITFTVILCWGLWNYKESLWLLGKLYSIVQPFIIGLFIAFIINVLMVKIEYLYQKILKKEYFLKWKRLVCLTISILIITMFLVFTVVMVIPQLHDSFRTLVKMLPSAWDNFNIFLKQRTANMDLYADVIREIQKHISDAYQILIDYLQNNKNTLLSQTFNATASIVELITSFVIGVVAAIYLLLEKEQRLHNVKRAMYAFCSKKRADYLMEAAGITNKIFTGFVAGQIFEVMILGLLYFVGMLILGFPYAFTISILVSVLGLIPLIGTFISFLIGVFLILVAAPAKIWLFCLFFIILQRIEGDLLYPKIVGKAVGLSELWVLAAVAVGGSIGGILGMIIGVPVCSVIYALLSKEVEQRLLDKKMGDL